MKKNHVLIASFTAAAVFIAGCGGGTSKVNLKKVAKPTDEIVEAEGLAPYHDSDIPSSKAAALAAAQRQAVELVVGVYVNAHTRVEKAVTVDQKILAKTKGYVKRYEILKEGRDGEWYKVRIRALVATEELKDDLDSYGLLKKFGAGNPRAVLFIQEWIGEKESKEGQVKRQVTEGLLKQGFRVIELPKAISEDEDAIEAAKGLSRSTAEIMVAGVGRAQPLGYTKRELGGLTSYRASVTLRAIEIGTGEVMATVSEVASGMEGTPEIAGGKALSNAAELSMKGLRTLSDEVTRRAHVTVSVIGLTSFETLAKVQKEILTKPGVRDLNLRSFEQMNGKVEMDVVTEGISEADLADHFVRIGGSTWSVYQVSPRSVQLNASLAGR